MSNMKSPLCWTWYPTGWWLILLMLHGGTARRVRLSLRIFVVGQSRMIVGDEQMKAKERILR